MPALTQTESALEPVALVLGLAGGLALFLYGMDLLTGALKKLAGGRMRSLLARLTRNRFQALSTGVFVTAVIQSSSVTTVLLVGFISAGLMSLRQSIGVILGADIASTFTPQILAFHITAAALPLVTLGFLLQFLWRHRPAGRIGRMLLGLGLLFLGMEVMGEATAPLRHHAPFLEMVAAASQPWAGILAGTLFTAVVQSSAATMGVVIVLASQGLVPLETGIYLAFGANIGTCITAGLAAIGKPREAVRAALAHVLIKVIGVAIWVGLVGALAAAVRWLSPAHPELTGTARLAAEAPRQIANAHTLFNVANVALLVWFTGPIARLVELLVPKSAAEVRGPVRPRYLDRSLLDTPDLALDRVRLELGRLGEMALRMVRVGPPAALTGDEGALRRVRAMDEDVDSLHRAIVTYLGRISEQEITTAQTRTLHAFLAAANHIENTGDTIETNLVSLGRQRLVEGVRPSPGTLEVLAPLQKAVAHAFADAVRALEEGDVELAASVRARKAEVRRLAEEAREHLADRLTAEAPRRLDTFRVESDIVEQLHRIYYFASRIARLLLVEERVGRDDGEAPAAEGR